VDVLVVVDEPLRVGQRMSLLGALNAMAPATRRRFDLTIVTAEATSRATRRPAAEVYYGFHGGSPEIVVADYLPSLVVELSAICRAANMRRGREACAGSVTHGWYPSRAPRATVVVRVGSAGSTAPWASRRVRRGTPPMSDVQLRARE